MISPDPRRRARLSVRLLGVLLCLATTRLAASPALADWPQVQHDAAHTGVVTDTLEPPFSQIWTWNRDYATAVRIAGRVQPIMATGSVFVGDLNGKLHALDAKTGLERWSFAANGPILGSAGYAEGRVVVASQDGGVYGVEAKTGQFLWRFALGAGIWAAPALANGRVYIGGRDGQFVCLDTAFGRPQWVFRTRGPILQTAACADGVVYFGSEDMHAYALDARTGRPLWQSEKLAGQSFGAYWPVVAGPCVVFGTQPAVPFHEILDAGDRLLTQTAGGGRDLKARGTPALLRAEQQAIRTYLRAHPETQTFFALDRRTGKQAFLAPVLYTAGVGGPPAPPIVNARGELDVVWRSYYSAFDTDSMVRPFAALGHMNARTGDITPYEPDAYPYLAFRLIGDETSVLSRAGRNLFVAMSESVGGLRTTAPRSAFYAVSEIEDASPLFLFSKQALKAGRVRFTSRDRRFQGHVAPPWGPAAIVGNRLYWIADGGTLACIQGRLSRAAGRKARIASPRRITAGSLSHDGNPERFVAAGLLRNSGAGADSRPEGTRLASLQITPVTPVIGPKRPKRPRTRAPRVQRPITRAPAYRPPRNKSARKQKANRNTAPKTNPNAAPRTPRRPPVIALPSPLKLRLIEEVTALVDGPNLAPFRYVKGISGAAWYWRNPAEVVYTVSAAAPFLPADLRARAHRFLRKEIRIAPPWEAASLPVLIGERRELCTLPPQAGELPPDPPRGWNLYALWKYGEAFDAWEELRPYWPKLRSLGIDTQTDAVGDIAGLIGYARIAVKLGHADAGEGALRRAEARLLRLRDFDAWAATFGLSAPPSEPHDVAVPIFADLTPEIARVLAANTKGKAAAAVEALTGPDRMPVWYPARAPTLDAGEDFTYGPEVPLRLFQARAWICGDSPAQLERCLDIPWCRGDLYYIQKLVILLEKAG